MPDSSEDFVTDEEIDFADALTTDELLDRFKRGHPTTVQVFGVTFGSSVAREDAVTLRPVDAVVGVHMDIVHAENSFI